MPSSVAASRLPTARSRQTTTAVVPRVPSTNETEASDAMDRFLRCVIDEGMRRDGHEDDGLFDLYEEMEEMLEEVI